MTKHDTWAQLKPNSPYEPILNFFPSGIPMRDPFPLERATAPNGEEVALWIIDLERLSSLQFDCLAQVIAIESKVSPTDAANDARANGGFAINSEWVGSVMCWAEGFARGKELADFLAIAPEVGTLEGARAFVDFRDQQYERWIEGNQQPEPINSIEDIDPRLRTPELEQIFKMMQIEAAIDQGGYSVMDVLSGHAMVNVLNIIDPENEYSLVEYDDDFEDKN